MWTWKTHSHFRTVAKNLSSRDGRVQIALFRKPHGSQNTVPMAAHRQMGQTFFLTDYRTETWNKKKHYCAFITDIVLKSFFITSERSTEYCTNGRASSDGIDIFSNRLPNRNSKRNINYCAFVESERSKRSSY